MNLADYKNIWVFIETECGKPKNVGFELINAAKPLAQEKGCELIAVVIGKDIEGVAKDAICYGADSAIIVDGPEYEYYTTDAFAKALVALVEKYKPETLMIGATNNGRDLGPRVSCRLKTGLTADCTAIAIDEETGNVAWTRPTFGGNLMATIMCPENRPQMGTVRPAVFKKGAYDEAKTGEIVKEEMTVDPDSFDYNFYSYGLSLYGNMPLIEPQEWKEVKKVEDFAIVIDTSMSCSGDLVKKFLEETYGVLTEAESFFHKVNIHIIQCDEMVQNDQKITDEKELKEYMEHLELIGEGGTDFRPAFEYVNHLIEQGEFYHLKGLIYFTDGKGTYPKKKPPYQTAFIFMQEEYEDVDVPPWAVKLIVDAEDLDEGEEEHEY